MLTQIPMFKFPLQSSTVTLSVMSLNGRIVSQAREYCQPIVNPLIHGSQRRGQCLTGTILTKQDRSIGPCT